MKSKRDIFQIENIEDSTIMLITIMKNLRIEGVQLIEFSISD